MTNRILKKIFSKDGFTMVEIIISALIFALAAAGIFATVSVLNQPVAETSDEVSAAFLGKQVLEDLRKQVGESTWDSGTLNPIGGNGYGVYYSPSPIEIDGVNYSWSYVVTQDPNTGARNVDLTVTW